MDAIGPYRALGTGVIVDDKGALDVDFDRSWVGNGLLKPRGSGGIRVRRGHGAIAAGLESNLRKNWRQRTSTSTKAWNKIIKEGAQLMFLFHVNVGGMEVPVIVRTAYISFCPEFVESLGGTKLSRPRISCGLISGRHSDFQRVTGQAFRCRLHPLAASDFISIIAAERRK